MSKSNRSSGSQFLHDLVTVDFGKVDIYAGVRIATILAPLLVIAFITNHVTGLFVFGFIGVAIMDEILPTSHRTRTLLSLSAIYASIFAISALISMTNYLVLPLLVLGLFLFSYFRVYPGGFVVLAWGAIMFVVGIAAQGATFTITVEYSLLIFIGGLWVIVAGAIFPAHKLLKPHTTTNQPAQQQRPQQPPAKLTRQDKYKLLTSNLSIHSQYFQWALALALTSAVGFLISQGFDLNKPDWVLVTIVVILMRPQFDISSSFYKDVHRVIGTFIGAIIAIGILSTVDNQWLLTLLVVLFGVAFSSLAKTGNYAFVTIFSTTVVLLLTDISDPGTGLSYSYDRFENIAIGCLLSLFVIFIFWIIPKTKSNQAIRKVG